ncbi:hypothetical protein ACYEXS_32020 [Paenibacillus sp. MAH-36]|uniref:Uncharacterized protein n=1 Tax=Paenibacillus violae TaxID=3077234 RepID=A0ABU3RQ86_9BACL|nr:hypothetical protein [Paenibacillus sp. PFR10]MDU0206471.1 hypothetical protein [Paenibacillus sp. PFR10]
MDQKELHEKLGRPESWAMTSNTSEGTFTSARARSLFLVDFFK